VTIKGWTVAPTTSDHDLIYSQLRRTLLARERARTGFHSGSRSSKPAQVSTTALLKHSCVSARRSFMANADRRLCTPCSEASRRQSCHSCRAAESVPSGGSHGCAGHRGLGICNSNIPRRTGQHCNNDVESSTIVDRVRPRWIRYAGFGGADVEVEPDGSPTARMARPAHAELLTR
jgi:hypothetical protein